LDKTATYALRESWITFIHELQDRICTVEAADGGARFREDDWKRNPGGQGGGGNTRIISNGNVFEKGGVNTSVVYGTVTEKMQKQLDMHGEEWFACGLSLVLHPVNPFVPTVHCNYRFFELYENEKMVDRWFGGGTDLTPFYLFDADTRHFHLTYKNTCNKFDKSFYPLFKKQCDDYFVNKHRNNERRGIGGIFFDRCRPDEIHDIDFWVNFSKACGNAFADAYMPIVEKRKDIPFTDSNKRWQEIRRGRYVEFNLIHDKGTLFGLKTNGRTESILMSLPPTVRFDYDFQPVAGSEEDKLLQACLHPQEWV
jgi:coproporphyrinogen III oxidase